MDEESRRKRLERKEIAMAVAVFAATSFALFPFAAWYGLAAAGIAAYNCGALAWEIRDELTGRRTLAWTAVVRTAISICAAILAVALWAKE